MPPDQAPHEAYLDAVFARIDRLRRIDAVTLTTRYGVDPSALELVSVSATSWPASQVLADAAAQREELREHLNGLTSEYVAGGLAYDAAVAKAHETLGDPEMLAMRISRSTAQVALGLNPRWMPLVRSIVFGDAVLLSSTFLPLFLHLQSLWFTPARMTAIWLAVLTLGMLQGYAVGICITPQIDRLIGKIVLGLEDLRKLRTLPRLTLRQILVRIQTRFTEWWLVQLYTISPHSDDKGRFPLFWLIMTSGTGWMFLRKHHDNELITWVISLSVYRFAKEWGRSLGVKRRLQARATS